MAPERITASRAHQLLAALGFESAPAPQRSRAFRHAEAGVIVLLADRGDGHPIARSDLVSLRRHLTENGLLGDDEFESFVTTGRLPRFEPDDRQDRRP